MKALILCLALVSCATTDHVAIGHSWYVDMPQYRYQTHEWNHLSGSEARVRVARMCEPNKPGETIERAAERALTAGVVGCSYRIVESGLCVIYSVYGEFENLDHRRHELAHCGVGMPSNAGWAHRFR